MRVLLVYPNIHGMNMLPPAIGLFTSLLKKHGHEVDLFDSTNWILPGENFDSDKQKEKNLNALPFDDSKLWQDLRKSDVFTDFRDKVLAFSPNLIAVSVTEDIYPIGIRLLNQIADIDIPVIMGGVFPTFAPEICLSNPEIDMVCIGEGESPLVELCELMHKGKPYYDVKNIWIKKNNEIIKNPLRPPEDIDKNPLIDLSLFDESRLYRPMQGRLWKMLPVETHRGCPYQCSYCNSPSQKKLYKDSTGCNFFRKKSFDSIHRELEYYKNTLKAEALYFWADTFMAYSDKEFDEFCEIYKGIRLPFWCQSRPEEIVEKRIFRLMEIGLFRIGIGIEHGNEEFRKRLLNRNVDNKTIINNLKVLNNCRLPFSVNNIIGFPTETRKLAMDTIYLNREIEAASYNAYSFSPFHGTKLRTISEELGYCDKNLIARSCTRPTLLNMPQFSKEQIEGLRKCFALYVLMPESRFNDIKAAEVNTLEANVAFEKLVKECRENYFYQNQ